MKFKNNIFKTVRAEKEGWNPKQIDAWIEAKLAEIKKTSPALWQFINDSQKKIFQNICHASVEKPEETCPAEEGRRYLVLCLLELAEIFKAQLEVEDLEKLWNSAKKRKAQNNL